MEQWPLKKLQLLYNPGSNAARKQTKTEYLVVNNLGRNLCQTKTFRLSLLPSLLLLSILFSGLFTSTAFACSLILRNLLNPLPVTFCLFPLPLDTSLTNCFLSICLLFYLWMKDDLKSVWVGGHLQIGLSHTHTRTSVLIYFIIL